MDLFGQDQVGMLRVDHRFLAGVGSVSRRHPSRIPDHSPDAAFGGMPMTERIQQCRLAED